MGDELTTRAVETPAPATVATMPGKRTDNEPISSVVERLDDDVTRQLLIAAAESHEDVQRAVRLAAADDTERIAVLRAAVDDHLRTRRHLDYWDSSAWAQQADPVVDELAREVAVAPTAELIELLQRAAGHLVKVIMRADDSNGMIGGLCQQVLELHHQACGSGNANPQKLAKWMVRFTVKDQDFFVVDPVSYVDALGDKGLSTYRRELAKLSQPSETDEPISRRAEIIGNLYAPFPNHATKYANVRLAIIDRDTDRLIEWLGRDLTAPHHFTAVAEAMIELDLTDDALAWARRGIAETSGWQVAKLYDLAARLLADAGDDEEVLALRRQHHERSPSASTYAALADASGTLDIWDAEIDRARALLAEANPSGYIDALLAEGDTLEAWAAASAGGADVAPSQWQRVAEAREATDPGDAMVVYLRLADGALVETGKRAYQAAIRHLKAARRAADASGMTTEFALHLAALREANRRRPSFVAKLDKAKLT